MLREITGLKPVALHALAGQRRKLAGQGLDQRGLARAVRPEQSEARARPQRQCDARHDGPARVAEHRLVERQQWVRRARGGGKLEIERRIDVRSRDVLEAVERLQATLRLARLRGLGTEALDELRHVRDLALLLVEERLLRRQPGRALHFEGAVVARVEGQPRLVEVRHVRHGRVEEVTVVRNQEQRAAVVRKPALDPHHGVEVEMVGRFVEQQQVRTADQRAREVEAHAPAAREIRDRAVEVGHGEAEPGHETRRAGARTVTVDAFEPGMEVCKRVPVVRCVRRCNGALDAAQFLVAVQHELDCRLGQRRGVLRDRGDTPVARHVAIARLAV